MITSILALALLAHAVTVSADNATVILPKTRPGFAVPLESTLVGFSLELDRWPLWAGQVVGTPNTFVNQALQNLADRTGIPPVIRVGGDTEDATFVDTSYAVYNDTFPPISAEFPYPEASAVGIGKDFYALSANLPEGTLFTWGLNLKSRNISETLAQAELLADTFQGSRREELSNVTLRYVEIGNESDFYLSDPFAYVDIWKNFSSAVAGVIDFSSPNGPKFQAGGFAYTNNLEWNDRYTISAGLLETEQASNIAVFSEHHYQGNFNATGPSYTAGDLANPVYIRSNLSIFSHEATAAAASGLKYVLGETNSFSHHGTPGASNGGEAAIWGVDYILQAASLGVKEINFHQGVGYAYNFIQPVSGVSADGLNISSRPHILAGYHAALVANEAVGSSGQSCVSEIGTNNSFVNGYAIWEDSTLARVVLINSEVYLQGAATPRPQTVVSLRGHGFDTSQRITAKRLYVPATNALTGITWAGQSFEGADAVPSGQIVEEDVYRGMFNMTASEVVLLCFK